MQEVPPGMPPGSHETKKPDVPPYARGLYPDAIGDIFAPPTPDPYRIEPQKQSRPRRGIGHTDEERAEALADLGEKYDKVWIKFTAPQGRDGRPSCELK